MANTSLVLDAVEDQVARLRRARPHLEKRIQKAEHILTMHFAMPERHIIRARVHGERVHYLVSGSGGAVYTVNPRDWSCSCPDHHRRGGTCKHALTLWILEKAYSKVNEPKREPAKKKRAYISGQSEPSEREVYARRNPLWGAANPERLNEVAERLGV